MNPAHLHLVLNHIPLIGLGFTTILLIIALLRKSDELMNISLIFVILVALWIIPAYLTGEPAEEMVEDMTGISERLVQDHEEAGEIAFIFIEALGALALISLILRRYSEKVGKLLTLITLLGLIVGGGLIGWTANLGGKINHPEIRSDTNYINKSDHKYRSEHDDD